MECCGTTGPQSWQPIFHNDSIPMACCGRLPVNQDFCDIEHAYKDGCLPKLLHFFKSKSLILASVGVGIALVQVISKRKKEEKKKQIKSNFINSWSELRTLVACIGHSDETMRPSKDEAVNRIRLMRNIDSKCLCAIASTLINTQNHKKNASAPSHHIVQNHFSAGYTFFLSLHLQRIKT